MQRMVPVKRTRSGKVKTQIVRVPRSLRYNGDIQITRNVIAAINYVTTGFSIGATTNSAMNIVFDPTQVTFFISSTATSTAALPNASELAALYELMRIDKVEMTWSTSQQTTGSTTTPAIPPRFLVCTDQNDGVAVTPDLAAIQQQNPKTFYNADGRAHKMTVRPKFQRIVYQTALVSNYEPSTGFVNSNAAIPHYGFKMGIANSGLSAGVMDVNFKYYMTLRNPK